MLFQSELSVKLLYKSFSTSTDSDDRHWKPVYGELLNWANIQMFARVLIPVRMRDVVILFVHLIVTAVRLARPGGLRSVVAESVLVKYQLLILNRGRKRAPNLRSADRVIAGLYTLFMRPVRVLRSAIVLKPSTLLHLHHLLAKRFDQAWATAWSERT